MGIVLFVVRKWSDCAILVTAILFLLQPVEWYHYIVGLFDPSHTLPDWGVGAMYKEVAEYTKEGNLWEFLGKNMTFGQKASLYWAFGAGRFWQTAGLFLMGLYIGRKQLFVTSEKHTRFWVKALIISAIAFAPLFQLKELIMASDSELIRQTAGTAFDMWQKFAFTFVLVASFVLLYQRNRFKDFVSNLRYYGKMSLTNYITQSIAGAIIYFPFGLYLAPYCGYTLSLFIGFVLFLLQVQFCKWWLEHHEQGVELYNCTFEPAYTIEQIVATMNKVTGLNRTAPLIPAWILMPAAAVIGCLGAPMGICPARVRKLMVSTNICGKKLADSGYHFHYTFEEAIADWFKDNDNQYLK